MAGFPKKMMDKGKDKDHDKKKDMGKGKAKKGKGFPTFMKKKAGQGLPAM